MLAKANSRATVHRPAYLDYVGVKTFDENGEVVGERRFLGLFSSAAYTESSDPDPAAAREGRRRCCERIGFDPRSHAGKALMDTLETYPRDELFHTPVDELAPMAEARACTPASAASCGCSSAATPTAATSRVLVYLPRDRYNTARPRAVLADPQGPASAASASSSTSGSASRRPPACTSSCTRRKGGTIPDVDAADLERRLTDASRSWRDDFIAAVIAEYGEDVGSRLGPHATSTRSPRPTRRTSAATTAALDLGRLEAIEGDAGIDLSLF